MQVGAFLDEFSEKGLAICGLPKKIRREITQFMSMLVVRIVDVFAPSLLVTVVHEQSNLFQIG